MAWFCFNFFQDGKPICSINCSTSKEIDQTMSNQLRLPKLHCWDMHRYACICRCDILWRSTMQQPQFFLTAQSFRNFFQGCGGPFSWLLDPVWCGWCPMSNSGALGKSAGLRDRCHLPWHSVSPRYHQGTLMEAGLHRQNGAKQQQPKRIWRLQPKYLNGILFGKKCLIPKWFCKKPRICPSPSGATPAPWSTRILSLWGPEVTQRKVCGCMDQLRERGRGRYINVYFISIYVWL